MSILNLVEILDHFLNSNTWFVD